MKPRRWAGTVFGSRRSAARAANRAGRPVRIRSRRRPFRAERSSATVRKSPARPATAAHWSCSPDRRRGTQPWRGARGMARPRHGCAPRRLSGEHDQCAAVAGRAGGFRTVAELLSARKGLLRDRIRTGLPARLAARAADRRDPNTVPAHRRGFMTRLSAEAYAIVEGRHSDPFHYLGLHTEGDRTVVRAFLPEASNVEALSLIHISEPTR